MAVDLEDLLERWSAHGVIDAEAAARIRAFERDRNGASPAAGTRWPVLLALIFGGVALGSGILLFVSAHWDALSPWQRMSLLVLMLGILHGGGAATASRFPYFAMTLHALGTVSLGGGIALAGQIFHLEEHWPAGTMLWALGAWVAWIILPSRQAGRRDLVQIVMAALLTPAWLAAEWMNAAVSAGPRGDAGGAHVLAVGLLILALTYFSALTPRQDTPLRFALVWIGGIALIPCTLGVVLASTGTNPLPVHLALVGWVVAVAGPLGLAWWLRGTDAWMNLVAAGWVLLLSLVDVMRQQELVYFLCAFGAVGVTAWGVREARVERINVGVIGFAFTVLFFYFSSLMDKLGRSASLIVLGVLFLAGGWLLERLRRRLVAQAREEQR
jgi:uncharacterized membrane protein